MSLTDRELNNDEEVVTVNTFEEILTIMCGKNEYGIPMGAATMAIDKIISEDSVETVTQCPLDCVFEVFCEGGAIVVQCDFLKDYEHEINDVSKICNHYVTSKNENKDNNEVLSMILLSQELGSRLCVVFMGLTYFFADKSNENKRLVLVFDNTLTEIVSDDNVNTEEIKRQIEEEYMREEKKLEEELYNANEELEKLQYYNPYEEEINQMIQNSDD